MKKSYPSRREVLVGGIALSASALLGYGRWIEPSLLKRTAHTVAVAGAPGFGPLRILHIADLHYHDNMPLRFLAEAFALGLRSAPDLVLITGDFVELKLPEHKEFRSLLRSVAERVPTFATMGNHDGGAWAKSVRGYEDSSTIQTLLTEASIDVLHNRSAAVETRRGALTLVGVGDSWAKEMDGVAAFREVSEEKPIVLLSHNPDSKDVLGTHPWSLMLSGHTHGGQLRIPITGGTPFAPVADHRYVSGLNKWRDRWIHTTQGVATAANFRFNCRPEVSVLDLVGG